MELKNTLLDIILSDPNINMIVSNVMSEFKLSQKSYNKCKKIIITEMINLCERVHEYPKDNYELDYAVSYLNMLCYDFFREYIGKKYPHRMPQKLTQEQKQDQSQLIKPIMIIDESEKNRLLNMENNNWSTYMNMETPISSSILLQLFAMSKSAQKITKCENPIIFDRILSENEVNLLLRKEAMIDNSCENNIDEIKFESKKEPMIDNCENNINEIKFESKKEPIIDNSYDNNIDEIDITNEDLDNLDNTKLLLLEDKIKNLNQKKNMYIKSNNYEKIIETKKEINRILKSILKYREKISQEKTKSIIVPIEKKSGIEHNIDVKLFPNILDLEIDPRDDYMNLTRIEIDVNNKKKISEILLHSYHVIYNDNNITRFNNYFSIYHNDKISKIIVPPGKYKINDIFNEIMKHVSFLELTVLKSNVVQIKNINKENFELIIENSPLLHVLGFTGNQDDYRDEYIYDGIVEPNISANDSVYFGIRGSSVDPIKLDFNVAKKIDNPIVLKKISEGMYIKNICLNLLNIINQPYDFLEPIYIKLEIKYIE